MRPEQQERLRHEVVAAYSSVTRLRVYMRLTLLTCVLFFVANLGGLLVGWLPVDVGVLGLLLAALTATTTVAKLLESVHRTTLYAMELERTLPGDEHLDTSSVSAQSTRTISAIAIIVAAILGGSIMAYSAANANTQDPVDELADVFITEDERGDEDDGAGDDDDD